MTEWDPKHDWQLIVVPDYDQRIEAISIAIDHTKGKRLYDDVYSKGISFNSDNEGNTIIPVTEKSLEMIENAGIRYQNPII